MPPSNSRVIVTMGSREIWDRWIERQVNKRRPMKEKKRLSHNPEIPVEREIDDQEVLRGPKLHGS
jgi:hypothetical protein